MNPAPPAVDEQLGMATYSTPGGRYQARLRARLEDFAVEELVATDGIVQARAPGLVAVYKVTKSGLDTPHLAREMGKLLKSEVNFVGMKDRNAVTVQYISPRSTRAESPTELKGDRFEAHLVGYSKPIARRMLLGNRFSILVETGDDLSEALERTLRCCQQNGIGNFFGYQRFGPRAMVNHRAGRAIIVRDFRAAVDLLLSEPRDGERAEAAEGRKLCAEGRYREAIPLFSRSQDLEARMATRLCDHPDDFIGALRTIPIAIRRLLVHSYQAYLFNLALSHALDASVDITQAKSGDNWAELAHEGLGVGATHGVKEPAPPGAVPLVQLVGFAYRDYGSRFDALIREILEEERVSHRQFYIKEAEELSSEGGFRPAHMLVRDLSYAKEDRGFRVRFSLGKGEYATVLLREVLKPEDPVHNGF